MGYGLPSAIGAKVAAPEKIVVDVDGDASFSMTAMELATASQYNIGVKVLVLNNEFQGMVLQWQGTISHFPVFSPHHFPPFSLFPSSLTDSLRSIFLRSLLRETLRSHRNDESRFRCTRESDEGSRDPM